MKKELKTAVLAIALVTTAIGAFATKVAHTPPAQDPAYNWTGSGPSGSGSLTDKTIAQARSFYGCNTGSTLCATGVDPNDENPNVQIQKAP